MSKKSSVEARLENLSDKIKQDLDAMRVLNEEGLIEDLRADIQDMGEILIDKTGKNLVFRMFLGFEYPANFRGHEKPALQFSCPIKEVLVFDYDDPDLEVEIMEAELSNVRAMKKACDLAEADLVKRINSKNN